MSRRRKSENALFSFLKLLSVDRFEGENLKSLSIYSSFLQCFSRYATVVVAITKMKEHAMKNPALLEDIKTYKGRDEVPEDFDDFWDEEVKKVSTLPAYQLEERDFHISQVKCYELTFEGSKEGKVYARVVLPKSDEKVPIIFHFHGYMGRGLDWADMLAYTVAGYGVVSMDVRGQSGYSQDGLRSPLGNTVKGHIIRGAVEGRDHLFYKDVYLDIYQLVEIIASLPEVDEKRLSSYGASQGGALALVAAALNPRIKKNCCNLSFLIRLQTSA